MKRSLRRVLQLAVLGLLVALGFLVWTLSRLGPVAVGYPAKIVCSETFLAGRQLDAIVGDMVKSPILDHLDISVDHEARQVEVDLFGVFSERAVFRDGLGCTRVPDGVDPATWKDLEPTRTPPVSAPEPNPELSAAVAVAFEEPDPTRPRNTRAFVVMHHGEVVAERYADGFSAQSRFPGWSMTKSVTGALVGLLVKDGRLDVHLPAPVPEWQGLGEHSEGDPRSAITLDQLLRMSSGLEFNEDYGMVTDVTRMLFVRDDAGAYAAQAKMAHEPDAVWDYSSGTTNIVARIVRDATDADPGFARRRLFDPLGMDSAVIEMDAAGSYIGSSFMYATARDWGQFGQLFLQGGAWDGEPILPVGWALYSTTPTPKAPRGRYGAQWWLNHGTPNNPDDRDFPQLPPDAFWADGYDGQMVMVVPSRDAVIVRLGLTKDESAYPAGEILAGVLAALPSGPAIQNDVDRHTATEGRQDQ